MARKIHLIPLLVTGLILSGFDAIDCAKRSPFDDAESELTINIAPGTSECFYQKAKKDDNLEIEYQVIDASFGEVEFQQDLDINFYLYSPTGKELITDFKRTDGMHRYEVKETGDYRICFDNSFSGFSKKTVYFEVFIDSNDDDYNNMWDEYSFSPELLYNDTMDQIRTSIAKVHENLNTVKHHQDQLKAIETRDRNIQEHNYTRVNQFSMVFIVVMLIVGSIQVLMVRSLFEEKSKLHKIFQLLS